MPVIIGEGGEGDPKALPLATRQRRHIPNVMKEEEPPAVMKTAIELYNATRPDAKLRSATATYNCMGMVFASRRTWVAPEHLTPVLDNILADDGYRRLADSRDVKVGDLVVYREPDSREASHVGVVASKERDISTASWKIRVMSKWGAYAEYLHAMEHVPLALGQPSEFWTDRKEV